MTGRQRVRGHARRGRFETWLDDEQQNQVRVLTCRGESAAGIATRLGLAERTIHRRRARLRQAGLLREVSVR